jgi:hypothetical protein
MMSDDPELRRFLDEVVELSADRHAQGPEAFIGRLEGLAGELASLRKYRTDRALVERFEDFAKKRLALVDEPSEYALAGDEVLVLSLALGTAAPLAVPAMKRAVLTLSEALTGEGVAAIFGQLLKRLQRLAREHDDKALAAWVAEIARALPSD